MPVPVTLKIGAWLSSSDTFVAHSANPNGAIVDLNDGATFTLMDPNGNKGAGLDWGMPEPTLFKGGNPKVPGQKVRKRNYGDNRTMVANLFWGQGTYYATWIAALRALIQTCEGISEARPGALQIQTTVSSTPIYADILSAHVKVPYDESEWMQLVETGLTVTFECKPHLRGARQSLQNLVVNPGFEGPSGPAVTVFTDTFANANAYTVAVGAAPAVASNVLTIASGSTLQFGASSWQDYNLYQVRFNWTTGVTFTVMWHYGDANDYYSCAINGTNIVLSVTNSGVTNTISTTSCSLVNTNWYWLHLSQLGFTPGVNTTSWPNITGLTSNANVLVTVLNDSAGTVGAQVATTGLKYASGYSNGAAFFGGPIRLSSTGGTTQIGGNFSNVHTVGLLGPGGWIFNGATNGATGQASGAWDPITTYPSGATTSNWSASITAPPTGTFSASWTPYNGGTPFGSWAMPVSPNQVLSASVYVQASGLGVSGQAILSINEYNSSGTFLRNTVIQTVTGTPSGWTRLLGTLTAGASTAYAAIVLQAQDTSGAGNSANAVVWFENCQVFNQTTMGVTFMPYCELWFSQTPCVMVVSGLLGDVPAPAVITAGTNWGGTTTLTLYMGRRLVQTSYPTMQLAATAFPFAPAGTTVALSNTDYSGFHITYPVASGLAIDTTFGTNAADWIGTFHLLCRAETTGGATPTAQSWAIGTLYGNNPALSSFALFNTSLVQPFAANGVQTMVDLGQVIFPPNAPTTFADVTQAATLLQLMTNTGSQASVNVIPNGVLLLPTDGETIIINVTNPSSVTNLYIAMVMDGWQSSLAFLYSASPVFALANAFSAGQATSLLGNSETSLTATGNRRVLVDPNLPGRNGTGVNQWGVLMTDANAAVYPLIAQLSYVPQYLYPQ